jgi:hypothetical protein
MGVAVMEMSFCVEAKMIGNLVHGSCEEKKRRHTRLGEGKQNNVGEGGISGCYILLGENKDCAAAKKGRWANLNLTFRSWYGKPAVDTNLVSAIPVHSLAKMAKMV